MKSTKKECTLKCRSVPVCSAFSDHFYFECVFFSLSHAVSPLVMPFISFCWSIIPILLLYLWLRWTISSTFTKSCPANSLNVLEHVHTEKWNSDNVEIELNSKIKWNKIQLVEKYDQKWQKSGAFLLYQRFSHEYGPMDDIVHISNTRLWTWPHAFSKRTPREP